MSSLVSVYLKLSLSSTANSSEEEKETLKESQREEQAATRESEEQRAAKGPAKQHQRYCERLDGPLMNVHPHFINVLLTLN